jgi:hypothetical protein
MKKQISNLIAAISFVFLCTVVSANAQADGKLVAHVPFDFYVQGQKLQAGDYMIKSMNPRAGQTCLLISRTDGKAQKMVILMPTTSRTTEGAATIVFNRYGDNYFLSEVINPAENFDARLRQSKQETNLARSVEKAERETVAINLGRR